MRVLRIEKPTSTGIEITHAHFGANVVYKFNTDSGEVNEGFSKSSAALSISHIRFPAGQGDHADASTEGHEWLNIVKMLNGELRPELREFLDYCRETGSKATLVLPTKFLSAEDYIAFGVEIEKFVEAVMRDFSDVVAAFEIGNEYWEMGETAYAAKVNTAAQAIASALDKVSSTPDETPLILVQMATPHQGSEYHVNAPGMADVPFIARLTMANEKLLADLTEDTKARIDGVVEHYYYTLARDKFSGSSDEFTFIDRDFDIWQRAIAQPLELHITEWNVKTTNIAENGMRSATTLLHQFDTMLKNGVDAAAIWAVQHNTPTDLTGGVGEPVELDSGGRVVNTIRGALFDMLADDLVGMRRLELQSQSDWSPLTVYSFATDERISIYIGSRSFELEEVVVDIQGLIEVMPHVSGLKLGYDKATSNGQHYNHGAARWEKASGLDLDGGGIDDYFINEHDVKAKFVDLGNFADPDSGTASFIIRPFEVVQLTLSTEELGFDITGTESDESFRGSSTGDSMYGGAGNDALAGMGGDDKLKGGVGSDVLKGQNGDDWMSGLSGDDILRGGSGKDFIMGGAGKDFAKAGGASDVVAGGRQSDRIFGNNGDDVLKGNRGADVLWGGRGDDTLVGGAGLDTFVFSAGRDSITDFEPQESVQLKLSSEFSSEEFRAAIESASIEPDRITLTFNDTTSLEIIGITDLSILTDALVFCS